jgi:SAM-dependent methyltransferase
VNPSDSASAFYDRLAPYYHLLYGDWEASIARQGAALARLLASCGVHAEDPVLDAACGIGTQTLGLVGQGYRLTASDVSPGAIERLDRELYARGLQARTHVDDLRLLRHVADASMAAVLACDNSIAHLLSDAELLQCFSQCHRCLRPSGVAVFSVRDYAAIPRVNPDVRPYAIRDVADERFLAVQVWDWEGDQYDLRMYLTVERPDGSCTTEVLRSRYYAVGIERLLELMQQAGFIQTQRLDDVLFQPVLLGRRAAVA